MKDWGGDGGRREDIARVDNGSGMFGIKGGQRIEGGLRKGGERGEGEWIKGG